MQLICPRPAGVLPLLNGVEFIQHAILFNSFYVLLRRFAAAGCDVSKVARHLGKLGSQDPDPVFVDSAVALYRAAAA